MLKRFGWFKRLMLLSGLTTASTALGQAPDLMGGGYPTMVSMPMYDEGGMPAGAPMPLPYDPAMAEYPPMETSGGGCGCGHSHGSAPVGLLARLGGCDDPYSCGSGGCGAGGCGLGAAGMCNGCGGSLGCGCPTCSGLLSRFCLFCRGEGCYLCRGMALGMPTQLLHSLRPYSDAGVAAQRWYDVSVEGTALSRSSNGTTVPILRQQVNGPILLSSGDLDTDGSEIGLRASVAVLFGVGGNLEATYWGLNQWEDSRTVNAVGGVIDIYQTPVFIPPVTFSQFTNLQTVTLAETNQFHSGEFNYRRRWVGPYGRFQGSWLAGVRYIDIDEQFNLSTVAIPAAQVVNFSSLTNVRNALTGGQLGGDLWWNIVPGINLGAEFKCGLLGNVAEQDTQLVATSADVTQTFAFNENADDSRTAYLSEINVVLVYRLSYSWTLRSSFVYMNIDNVATGRGNFNPNVATNTNALSNAFQTRDVVLNNSDEYELTGWTFGAEYMW